MLEMGSTHFLRPTTNWVPPRGPNLATGKLSGIAVAEILNAANAFMLSGA